MAKSFGQLNARVESGILDRINRLRAQRHLSMPQWIESDPRLADFSDVVPSVYPPPPPVVHITSGGGGAQEFKGLSIQNPVTDPDTVEPQDQTRYIPTTPPPAVPLAMPSWLRESMDKRRRREAGEKE